MIPDFSDRSLIDLLSISGHGAVVTGGARGIGLAIAHRMAEAGADVLIADTDSVARAADRAVTEFGGLHIGSLAG